MSETQPLRPATSIAPHRFTVEQPAEALNDSHSRVAPPQRYALTGRWFAQHAANLLTSLRLLLVAPIVLLVLVAVGITRTILTGVAWVVIALAVLLTVASLVECAFRPLVRHASSDDALQ